MLWDYIRSRRVTLAVWAIVCVLFAAVFALYSLPLKAVLYGAAVSGFFGLTAAAVDFLYYRRKRLRLKKLADEIIYTIDGLPSPVYGIEEDYCELVRILYENMRCVWDEMSEKYSDMTEYYTIWAHQIKTPIAAMGLILQEAGQSDELNREQNIALCREQNLALRRELSDNLQRIEQYAEMVMCYLRLDSDSTDYVIKEYDLDGIVRQAVRKFSRQFIRKKLSLTYEPLRKTVLTDEKWLLFVIEQVISNAVKYTKTGGAEIYCEEPLTLCIRDTGIGAASEDLPRLFEKGYTGCNGRLDKKASGIGLYLCKRICTKLGHGISAENAPGGGLIIKLNLETKQTEHE
ncbi:MAG: sensor histidine kinase [Oscillospiraceae bacterium]|nr:sensor histidine kinase [Oscillospiraceae bacterium]